MFDLWKRIVQRSKKSHSVVNNDVQMFDIFLFYQMVWIIFLVKKEQLRVLFSKPSALENKPLKVIVLFYLFFVQEIKKERHKLSTQLKQITHTQR